jgi:hypothetical protein
MGNLPHIGDDEKLALIPGWAIINGHEQASPEGAKIDLCIRYVEERHRGFSHGQALQALGATLHEWYPHAPRIWEHEGGGQAPGPDPGPTDPPGPLPGLHPALAARKIPWGQQLDATTQGYILRGDGTLRLPVGLHAGDFLGQWVTLPGRRDLLRRALDTIYTAGYNHLRCWLNVDPNPWWEAHGIAKRWNPITTPGFDQEYDSFLGELEQRQLTLHLAAGGLDILPKPQYREMFNWLRQRVGAAPHRYCLIESVNEGNITAADWSPAELEDLVMPILPHCLCALTAGEGTEDRRMLRLLTPPWMAFCYYHSYRQGHLHDKYRHHFSFVRHEAGEDPVRRIAWSGEPTGPGPRVSGTHNHDELNDRRAVAGLHVQTALSRTLPTYMCSPGVIFDQPFTDMPGFAATPWAVARLPQDIHGWHLTHGGQDDAVIRATTTGEHGVVRADQAHGPEGQIACTLYSVHAAGAWCDLPVMGSLEGQIFDGTGAEVAAGRYDGRISAPVYPLAYFVGRRV